MGVLAGAQDSAVNLGHGTYLALELSWAIPVLLIQWAVGYRILRGSLRLLLVGSLVPTVYLSFADHVALSQGIWRIQSDRIIQIYLGNVPLEECVFFLVTNLMIVQSIILVGLPRKNTFSSWFRLTLWSSSRKPES
jgi:lycopene beta-cyclase